MRERTEAITIIVGLSFGLFVSAQSASTNCPPVTPRNPAEALQMEQSSNKTGCWVRQKKSDGSDGNLVFVSKLRPDQNFKPQTMIPTTEGVAKWNLSGMSTTPKGPNDLAGIWIAANSSPDDKAPPALLIFEKNALGRYVLHDGYPPADKYWSPLEDVSSPSGSVKIKSYRADFSPPSNFYQMDGENSYWDLYWHFEYTFDGSQLKVKASVSQGDTPVPPDYIAKSNQELSAGGLFRRATPEDIARYMNYQRH
jgi:hypothetical protein